MNSFSDNIASSLNLKIWQIENTLQLLEEGASIPFIARYRKERTGELSDIQIIEIEKLFSNLQKLSERKASIISSLQERELLSPELNKKIELAETINELEDIYLPYRPKRKTKSSIAISQGLEPLAKMIMSENLDNPKLTAERFVDINKGVSSAADALQGARNIIAEWISENESTRKALRRMFHFDALIVSKVVKTKIKKQKNIHLILNGKKVHTKPPPIEYLQCFEVRPKAF